MTTFDKREEGFEKKFAHDEELRFKANARRNRLLGMWAAEKLGLTGDAAIAYAKEVVMADFEESGDNDVLTKVKKDLEAKGVASSDQEIRRQMTDLMEKAITDIKPAERWHSSGPDTTAATASSTAATSRSTSARFISSTR